MTSVSSVRNVVGRVVRRRPRIAFFVRRADGRFSSRRITGTLVDVNRTTDTVRVRRQTTSVDIPLSRIVPGTVQLD